MGFGWNIFGNIYRQVKNQSYKSTQKSGLQVQLVIESKNKETSYCKVMTSFAYMYVQYVAAVAEIDLKLSKLHPRQFNQPTTQEINDLSRLKEALLSTTTCTMCIPAFQNFPVNVMLSHKDQASK